MVLGLLLLFKLLFNDIKNGANCLQFAPFGCDDLYGTNFYKFYRRLEEIGVLYVSPDFERL
jgi:hypothetical protein